MRRIVGILIIAFLAGWMMFGCGPASRKSKSRSPKTETVSPPPTQDSTLPGLAEPFLTEDTLQISLPEVSFPDSLRSEEDPFPLSDTIPSREIPVRDSTHSGVATDGEPDGDIIEEDIIYEDDILENDLFEERMSDSVAISTPVPGANIIEDDAQGEPSAITTPTVSTTPERGPGPLPRRQRARPETVSDSTVVDSISSDTVYRRAPQRTSGSSTRQDDEEGKLLHFTSDRMHSIPIGPDSSAFALVGNVVLYHNGAVITCDSAVRYSERRMDCFRRVVINKETTYIYGDKAEYDGDINTATVYAPIIKMVDEDAVLYTYRLSFNTLDNICRYGGGGTMTQNDNLMESRRGYYFTDTREFVGVDSVELRNPEYRMTSDSVSYNLDSETAMFFTKSFIWNDKGEILSAEHGQYRQPTAEYHFTRDSYILTETRQIWADTIDYNSRTGDATFYLDIQFLDEEENTMAFGDYGEYWDDFEEGMLTRNPSLVSFDPQEPDTLYMRSDSMFFYTFDRETEFVTTVREGQRSGPPSGMEEELIEDPVEETEAQMLADSAVFDMPESLRDSLGLTDSLPPLLLQDSLAGSLDEGVLPSGEQDETFPEPEITADTGTDEPLPDSEDPRTAKKRAKEERRLEKQRIKQERRELRERIISGEAAYDHDHDHNHENESLSHDEIHRERKEQIELADSLAQAELDSLALADFIPEVDSLGRPMTALDSLGNIVRIDSLGRVIPQPPEAEPTKEDSLQRIYYAYRDVRIYREDFQAVCDSLVGFSIDSTMHMYVNPVIWAETNQILADVIDIFARDGELYKAEFYGSPFASQQVDGERFNQIKGKFMEAWFRDNDIYRHDVTGNTQTYYYMEDEDTGDLTGFLVAESADASFLIEDQQISDIIYRWNPVYTMYPMDDIPASQEQIFPDFKWEADRRPKRKEDVFNRVIKPSQREEYLTMPQPAFPITDRIIRHKDSMIERGIWRERNDVLGQHAIEFINSIEK